jgi:hypothetical protein
MNTSSSTIDYLPLLLQMIVAGGFVVFTLFVTHILMPRLKSKKKDANFECGIELRDDEGEVLNINGFVKSFKNVGEFKIDFQAANNSMKYNLFKETVGHAFH